MVGCIRQCSSRGGDVLLVRLTQLSVICWLAVGCLALKPQHDDLQNASRKSRDGHRSSVVRTSGRVETEETSDSASSLDKSSKRRRLAISRSEGKTLQVSVASNADLEFAAPQHSTQDDDAANVTLQEDRAAYSSLAQVQESVKEISQKTSFAKDQSRRRPTRRSPLLSSRLPSEEYTSTYAWIAVGLELCIGLMILCFILQPSAIPGNSSREDAARQAAQSMLNTSPAADWKPCVLPHVRRANLQDFYSIDEKRAAQGRVGCVYTVRARAASSVASGVPMTVKSIRKEQPQDSVNLVEEIAIMQALSHPSIIRLHEVFQDSLNLYVVTEACDGGDMMEYLSTADRLTETDAACVIGQLFKALQYMHGKSICHRDVQPTNLVFLSAGPIAESNPVKLTEFGFACHFGAGRVLKPCKGTADFASPQLLDGKHDESCDLWSAGVILYMLLCGFLPFHDSAEDRVVEHVMAGEYNFDGDAWRIVSEEAKNLVCVLLEVDPKKRYTADQALNHIWLQRDDGRNEPNLETLSNARALLDNSSVYEALTQCVADLTAVQANKFRMEVKIKQGHTMTKDELRNRMSSFLNSIGQRELSEKFTKDLTFHGSNVGDYIGLFKRLLDTRSSFIEELCWRVFCQHEIDGGAYVVRKNIVLVLKDIAAEGTINSSTVQQAAERAFWVSGPRLTFDEMMKLIRSVEDW